MAVIYISHRLHELPEIADTVSVLRGGILVGTIPIAEATPETVGTMMFGKTVQHVRPAELNASDEQIMSVRHLSMKNKLNDVSFTLNRGEILGIGGMVGAGRSELLRAIFGADAYDEGEISIRGRRVTKPTLARMKPLGVGFTPENRKDEGLVQILSVCDNASHSCLDRISQYGVLLKKRQRAFVQRLVDKLGIVASDFDDPVSSLSGGNQQKVVVGKWLNTAPRIMLFDEPTRGIDVQAKQQIFEIISDLSSHGISSILVSSELEELVEVCHRVLVMRQGRIVGELGPDELRLDKLLELSMTGGNI